MIYDTYIEKLLENYTPPKKTEHIDIVLDTGAFNGIYLFGSLLYLKKLEEKKAIKIERISGASIGAICGMLYILNKLEIIDTLYSDIRKNIRRDGTLQSYHTTLVDFFKTLDDNEYQKLNGKLFMNYQCTNTKKSIVVCEYKSNNDVLDKLYKTSFLPLIINGELSTDGYIDGINPYIFPEKSKEDKKILYLNLLSLGKLKSILNTKHDKNTCQRTVTGILQTHDFFTQEQPNSLCSYVNDWNLKDIAIFRGREIFCFISIYIISILISIFKKIPKNLNDAYFIKTVGELILKLYKDCMVYMMFDM